MDSATSPWFKSSDWDINLVDSWEQYYFDYDDILRLPVLSLFPYACGKDRNCTRACATLTEAFSDPPTLSNCIRYPLVASLLHNDLLSRNGMAQAQMLGFSNGSMTASKHSANAISGCLSSVPIVSPSSINTFTDANGVNYSYPDICSSMVPALNGDIGGIGTYVSYYMQMGIVITCILLVKICASWAYWLATWVWLATWLTGLKIPCYDPAQVQKSLQKHLSPLTVALVDFHKAQCYFMLAVQAAATVISSQLVFFEATSSRQLDVNHRFLNTVATAGLLPIVMVLVMLHSLNQRSLYMLILSITTSTFATIVSKSTTAPVPWWELVNGPSSSVECGGVYAYRYCGPESRYSAILESLGVDHALSYYVWLVYALLLADFTLHRCRPVRRFVLANKWTKSWTRSDRCGYLLYSSYAFSCFYSGVSVFLSFRYVWKLTRFQQMASISTRWTFGQIIAVTIWFPPILEFIYLEIRGMRSGSRYRLAEPYIVTHRSELGGENSRNPETSAVSEFMLRPWMKMLGKSLDEDDTPEPSPSTGSKTGTIQHAVEMVTPQSPASNLQSAMTKSQGSNTT